MAKRIVSFALILMLLLLTTVLFQVNFVWADSESPPTFAWSKTYTYGTYCGITAMTLTSDDGYALGGYVVQLGTPGETTADAWLLKLDVSGNKEWEQGLSEDYLNLGQITSIVQASDDGYVMACVHLVKTDSLGNVEWKQTYTNISLNSVVKTSDDGYGLAGSVHDGGFWLAKVNSNGSLQWSQIYGGQNNEFCNSLAQTVDGGYALAGSTYSYVTGTWDMWLVKTDSAGKMMWNQTYSTLKDDQGIGVVQTSNNGYILAGSTDRTLCLVRFDSLGIMVWNQTYNQVDNTLVRSIIKTTDGGYAVAADSGMIKFDASGNLQWTLPYDGTYAVIQKDNEYVLAGSGPGTSPGGGWIASTAAAPATSAPTPSPTASSIQSTTPSPTASMPQSTNSTSTSPSASSSILSNYPLVITLTVIVLAIVGLIIIKIKNKKK